MAGDLHRIDFWSLCRTKINRLTKRQTSPEYRAVVEAIARRDKLRLLVDGMPAANGLGLTDAVPARLIIKPIPVAVLSLGQKVGRPQL